MLIIIFAVNLQWFPSVYDTTLRVTDWQSFGAQLRQMAMPVAVLALYNAAEISRYMRAAMLDTLGQDYVRTARAKGLSEQAVVLKHVLRNAMIPVVTVIAMGVPGIFGGAIITEQVFKVNGLGALLINSIQGSDLPMVQTLTFIFAVLIVFFNLIAECLFGGLGEGYLGFGILVFRRLGGSLGDAILAPVEQPAEPAALARLALGLVGPDDLPGRAVVGPLQGARQRIGRGVPRQANGHRHGDGPTALRHGHLHH